MRRSILAAVFTVLVPMPLTAQDIMGGGINQSWGSTQLLLNSEKQAWAAPECIDEARWSIDCKGSPPPRQARPPATEVADEPALDEAALTFRPSIERRRRNFANFMNRSRAVDPAGADQLQAFLAQDVIGFVAKEVAPLGLRTDNLADAMTIYVIEAWEATNAKVMAPSRARSQALRRQMMRAIAGMPNLTAADDAVKQESAEAMLVQAVMVSNAIKLAIQKGDKTEIAAVQDAAQQGALATLGMDLRSMSMTEAGLR
jgi:hypothetical protein